MPAAKKIRMTLTGPFKGVTKLFGRYQFIKGICDFIGNEDQVANVAKYFTRSYQVKVKDITGKVDKPVDDKPVDDPEAARVDNSDVVGDEQIQDVPEEPNPRQADIIAAVNGIEKEEWVDLKAKTPRPRVKDVSVLMEDPTVTKAEIVEVIEKWLS